MLGSKSDNTKGFGHRGWRVFHSVAVAAIYLICFVGLHGLSACLQIFPEIGPWNLSAGLSLWLLDFSFGYLPVVLAAHVISLIWPSNALTGWQMMMMASTTTAVYALWSMTMRKLSAQPRIDLLDRRSLFSFIITAPAMAMLLSTLVTAELTFAGYVAGSGVDSAVLAGLVGNTIGMVLVTPFFLWSGDALTEALLDAMGGDVAVRRRTEAVPPIPSPMSAIPLAIFGALLYFFLGSTITDKLFVLFCLISAPLICMALKYGLNGAASVLLMLGVVATVSAQTEQPTLDPLWIQVVVIVSSLNTMVIGSLVSQGRSHEATTTRHAALLNSISFATEQLLAMTDQDKNVNEVLRHLATEAGVSRIYVVENRQSMNGSIAYEHWSEDAAVDQHYLQLLNVVRSKHIRDRADSLAKGEALQYRAADLPEDEHAIMSALNIRVSIILPIFAGGQWWSCVGMDEWVNCRFLLVDEVDDFTAESRVIGR